MNTCYLCGIELEDYTSNSTANHEEHIIPQAIGGQLTVRGILCKTCGGEKYLGGTIDAPFSAMFNLITERLEIKRDRRTNSVALSGKLQLLHEDRILDVSLRDNVLTHRRPEHITDHDNKIVKIFANEIVARDYRKKVEKELRATVTNSEEYTFTIISDLFSYEEFKGILELPFRLDNKLFEAGFTKIAIEYALSQGVPYSSLSHLIDREHRTLRSEGVLLPYYPIYNAEEVIEYLRSSIDESFMSHSLVLFSQRQIQEDETETKQLYCFVELFGTFQYFVRLNNEYTGENIEPVTYSQRVIKDTTEPIAITGLSPKDVSIYMMELGIPFSALDGKTDQQARQMIEQLYNSRNRYLFNYTDNIKRLVDRILYDAMINRDEQISSMISEIADHFYFDIDTDDFRVSFFRSRYQRDKRVYSIIPEIEDILINDRPRLDEYTHFKFKELESFINENRKPTGWDR